MRSFAFYDPCPFTQDDVAYPVDLEFTDNREVLFEIQVPKEILDQAGVRSD